MKNQRSNDTNFLLRAFFVHCYIHIYQIISSKDSSTLTLTQPLYSGLPDFNYSTKSKTSLSQTRLIPYLKTFFTYTNGIF